MTATIKLLSIGLCAWIVGATGSPLSAGYVFTRIVDNSGMFTSFQGVALSNNGQVAFYANFNGGTAGTSGLFRYTSGVVTTIATNGFNGAPTSGFDNLSHPGINNSGQVTFTGGSLQHQAVAGAFLGTGGAPTSLPNNNDQGFGEGFSSSAVINNSGRVVFIADNSDQPPIYESVFMRQFGAGLFTVADAQNPPFLDFGNRVDINSNNIVTFTAQRTNDRGVFTGDENGNVVEVVTDSGQFSRFTSVSLNDSGEVVIRADNDAGGHSIYKITNGNTVEIANTFNTLYTTLDEPSMNNDGEVLFSARAQINGAEAIFDGINPLNDRLLGVGDALDGSTITAIRLYRFGLNDADQFAFVASLADGRQGIYLATVIPEPPSTVLLAASGFVCLTISRRRR